MSTKMGDQKIYENLHKLKPKYRKMPKIIWLGLHFGCTQDYFGKLYTFNYTIQFICVNLSQVWKKTQHQTIYIEILY